MTWVNRRIKGWPGWALLAIVLIGFLAYGATRHTGPRTPEERVDSISKRVACPVCAGESVYESRHPTSVNIVRSIEQQVRAGELTDDEIVARIVAAREGRELLVPTASGLEALAWALPAAALVFGAVGLTLAFRRWREETGRLGAPTDDDYAIVAAEMKRDER